MKQMYCPFLHIHLQCMICLKVCFTSGEQSWESINCNGTPRVFTDGSTTYRRHRKYNWITTVECSLTQLLLFGTTIMHIGYKACRVNGIIVPFWMVIRCFRMPNIWKCMFQILIFNGVKSIMYQTILR